MNSMIPVWCRPRPWRGHRAHPSQFFLLSFVPSLCSGQGPGHLLTVEAMVQEGLRGRWLPVVWGGLLAGMSEVQGGPRSEARQVSTGLPSASLGSDVRSAEYGQGWDLGAEESLLAVARETVGPWAGRRWPRCLTTTLGLSPSCALRQRWVHVCMCHLSVCVCPCVSVCPAEAMRGTTAPRLGSPPTLPEARPEQVP